ACGNGFARELQARRDESGNELGPRRWRWRRWTFASARFAALDRRFEFHDRHRRDPRTPGGFENHLRTPLQGASLIREACLAAIEYAIPKSFDETGVIYGGSRTHRRTEAAAEDR